MYTNYETCLLKIARDAIQEKYTGQSLIDTSEIFKQYPDLTEPGAVFITITKDNQLRGCIGSIQRYRSLLDDIRENSKSAAFKDPRFSPLEPDELNEIKIEISILSASQPLNYQSVEELKTKIKPATDGIILTKDYHKAVFLPQVWEKLSRFDEFFESLCKKAGLSSNCLTDKPQIELFTVTTISE
jgi:AmmeMemoRadiSam system protein A